MRTPPRPRGLLSAALGLSLVFGTAAALAAPQGNQSGGPALQQVKRPPPPARPNCHCYFSSDCLPGTFCYWGPGGPFTEDHCSWRVDKPGGVPGANCDSDTDDAGGCDGICQTSRMGSELGGEDRGLVVFGIDLWSQAMLTPAANGGGPVDPDIAALALSLPFESRYAAEVLGRTVGGVAILAGGQELFHPDPALGIPAGHCAPRITQHHVEDLTKEPWRLEAMQKLFDALQAEMAGDVAGVDRAFEAIRQGCPDPASDFQPVCGGDGALLCVRSKVQDIAVALITPRVR